jgi:hypothetical protein
VDPGLVSHPRFTGGLRLQFRGQPKLNRLPSCGTSGRQPWSVPCLQGRGDQGISLRRPFHYLRSGTSPVGRVAVGAASQHNSPARRAH